MPPKARNPCVVSKQALLQARWQCKARDWSRNQEYCWRVAPQHAAVKCEHPEHGKSTEQPDKLQILPRFMQKSTMPGGNHLPWAYELKGILGLYQLESRWITFYVSLPCKRLLSRWWAGVLHKVTRGEIATPTIKLSTYNGMNDFKFTIGFDSRPSVISIDQQSDGKLAKSQHWGENTRWKESVHPTVGKNPVYQK